MKSLFFIGFALLCGIVLYRCKASNSAVQNTTEVQTKTLFALSKGPCRGTCKVYDFSVDQTGKAYFKGIRNTENTGEFSAQLSANQLANLRAEIQAANKEALQKEYPLNMADMQKVSLQIEELTIKYQKKGGPRDLFKFTETAEQLIAELNWERE